MSTRDASDKQEKRVAKAIGGKQVIGSGATPFLKGDVSVEDLFIEAKTKIAPSESIKVQKEWITKAREQAYQMRKQDSVVAISFDNVNDYYIVEADLFIDLYKSRQALLEILEKLGGTEDSLFDAPKVSEFKYLLRERGF